MFGARLGASGFATIEAMSEVTRILSRIESGDSKASDQLLPIVYSQLRKLATGLMASEKAGQTLQPTALVHEAYVRLVDAKQTQDWNSTGHFYRAAAEAMRRILIEQARKKGRLKRGSQMTRRALELNEPYFIGPNVDLIAVDEVLGRFAELHPEKAELVKLRYFAGLTLLQAAKALGVSSATADRYWKFSRAWLARELRDSYAPEN
jgi:RNA polymerase sigma factor (TIGR02999 family)